MMERLLIISSRARNKSAVLSSINPKGGVFVVQYNYDTTSLEDLLSLISKKLNKIDRISNVAFIIHSSERELFLCRPGEAKLSLKSSISDVFVRNFFVTLVSSFLNLSNSQSRIDFLATYAADHIDGGLISKELESLLKCKVGLSKNLKGEDIQGTTSEERKSTNAVSVGELFFDVEKLDSYLSKIGTVSKDGATKLMGFEKIRLVGKGAFGNAILYRRRADGLFVIIKEINILELSASDRTLAMNEVKVLAKMDHPHIVTYFDSFEVDGVLMIEMEYADGGNLADDLEKRTSPLEEKEILDIFSQMVSAIRHMHSHNVLHRDLKTANIFLTKEKTVKIGDFGISKILSTQQGGAVTVLGTPYYISPEMCEGKIYDEKSDLWALGCILYEMACLQKTFEGSNLPALVNKIIRGQFAPIRGDYSPLFKQLVRDLLQRDPDFRPTASEVMLARLPELLAFNESLRAQEEDEREAIIFNSSNDGFNSALNLLDRTAIQVGGTTSTKMRASRPIRSILYDLRGHESGLTLTPIRLPSSIRIVQVSASGTHFIALTSEFLVFTWGQGARGQLGHGVLTEWVNDPTCVELLKAKSITKVSAGDGFSVFASDNGILMTCGDGSFGCLGHGDWNSSASPRLVESLLSFDVSVISCGSEHVAIVGNKGDVFSWGRGSHGCLGQGNEEDSCVPAKMVLETEDIYIVNVKCSGNGTILLSDGGTMYSCGENRYNRLGLDDQIFFVFGNRIVKALIPTKVNSVRGKHRIVDFDMGIDHTVCITDERKVISFGKNADGQLGRGHSRSLVTESGYPEIVKAVSDKEVNFASCGPTFTVIGTNENVLYFWGTRHHSMSNQPENETVASEGELIMKDVVLEPTELLALYASEQHLQKGETVVLSGIAIRPNHGIFVWVDTTCPTPRIPTLLSNRRKNHDKENALASSKDSLDKRRQGNAGKDSDVPDWLKSELKAGVQAKKDERKVLKKKQLSRPEKKRDTKVEIKDNKIFKKLENDYNRRRQEIMLEAEVAVRVREEALNNEVVRLREELDKQKSTAETVIHRKSNCSIS